MLSPESVKTRPTPIPRFPFTLGLLVLLAVAFICWVDHFYDVTEMTMLLEGGGINIEEKVQETEGPLKMLDIGYYEV